jgi:hypothetical protein
MVDILERVGILVLMEQSLISKLLLFVLYFNIAAVVVVFLVYLKDRQSFKDQTSLETFCCHLPKDAKISDPQVLVDGKWMKRDPLDKDQSG